MVLADLAGVEKRETSLQFINPRTREIVCERKEKKRRQPDEGEVCHYAASLRNAADVR
jgi:hypothetical protein